MASALFPTTQTDTKAGRFGAYGGRYVPETLMAALRRTGACLCGGAGGCRRSRRAGRPAARIIAGRPTPLYFAKRLTETAGRRQDLPEARRPAAHRRAQDQQRAGPGAAGEAHGQAAHHRGDRAGQHGVATATVCALLGMECVVYMGEEDMRRQELNVFRMRLLGAEVRGVTSGSATLKDADQRGDARLGHQRSRHPTTFWAARWGRIRIRPWCAIFIASSAMEAKRADSGAGRPAAGRGHCLRGRRLERDRRLLRFIPDDEGAADRRGSRRSRHSAGRACGALSQAAAPGVLQGTYSYVLQDEDGQIAPTHSVSAGLDYASIGPGACGAARLGPRGVCRQRRCRRAGGGGDAGRTEGILPALEIGARGGRVHEDRAELPSHDILVINLSGRGDKDMGIITRELNIQGA